MSSLYPYSENSARPERPELGVQSTAGRWHRIETARRVTQPWTGERPMFGDRAITACHRMVTVMASCPVERMPRQRLGGRPVRCRECEPST